MLRLCLALNHIGVLREHRRRGVGALLMSWAMKKAKSLQVESFLETSSDYARFFFERFGYRCIMKFKFVGEKKEMSAKWKRLNDKFGSQEWYAMWRPVNGEFENEEMPLWEFMQHYRH